jgi:hypothetical protein
VGSKGFLSSNLESEITKTFGYEFWRTLNDDVDRDTSEFYLALKKSMENPVAPTWLEEQIEAAFKYNEASGDPIEGSTHSVEKESQQKAAIYTREQLDERVQDALRSRGMPIKGKILELERQHLELDLYRANQEKIGEFASSGNSNRLDLSFAT